MVRQLALLTAFLAAVPSFAQPGAPSEKHEFRGAWIATVANLDWPTSPGANGPTQRAELAGILDALQAAGINAVMFQVRTESDALYWSDLEPASYWLTGEQGRDPTYDPLFHLVRMAHERGMEAHAWFNPYRADRGSGYTKAATHVTQTHPEWILDFGSIKITDPGLPAVRDHVARIVSDVARRYDIDGVHFDDYFYPYPPNQIVNEDAASFAAHNRGIGDRGTWRRGNVNLLIAQVNDSLQTIRPDATFGISPFGIWKDGVPSGIRGLDAYNVIYADATAWLDAEIIDYVTPQLYWSFGGNQDYGKLAPWWESVRNGRHLYPGHGLYRTDRSTFSNTLFSASEIPNQVRFNRARDGIQGSVFFRAKNISTYSSKGFADSLATTLYRRRALTPSMAWKSQDAPGTPTNLTATHTSGEGAVALAWTAPASGDAEARFYAIYRIPTAEAGDLAAATADGRHLVLVTGNTEITDYPDENGDFVYVVTAASHNSIESDLSNTASVQGVVSSERQPDAVALRLETGYPNPFRGQTAIRFTLDRPQTVTLRVIDALGREVARLMDEAPVGAGPHETSWRPGPNVRAGTYFLVLQGDREHVTRSVVYIR